VVVCKDRLNLGAWDFSRRTRKGGRDESGRAMKASSESLVLGSSYRGPTSANIGIP
jgi:hypothetical protein